MEKSAKYLSWNNLSVPIHKVLISCLVKRLKCSYVAKVQKATIPLLLQKKNLVVQACTGSGKTLAYLLPIFQRLIEDKADTSADVNSIVMLPSRELAIQVNLIANTISKYIKKHLSINIPSLLLIGGTSIENDLKIYKENPAKIIIGTPGRMHEFIQQSEVSLNEVEYLILDEGDKILEQADCSKLLQILDKLPSSHITGVFSATISQNLEKLIAINMPNALQVSISVFKGDLANSSTILAFADDTEYDTPIEVKQLTRQSIAEQSQNSGKKICELPQAISNYYISLDSQMQKLNILKIFIEKNPHTKCIIFFSTCACVEYYFHLFSLLFPNLLNVGMFDRMHRKIAQKNRNKIYESFLAASEGYLLCTDILARGIDIPDIQWIIQYDPPQHSDSFLHRIGRTARAGKQGNALILLIEHESAYVEFLKVKGIKVDEEKEISKKLSTTPSITIDEIQDILKTDRDLVDKSVKAYVSYIRYYNEHELCYLFQLKKLDVGDVANAFGLFYMPGMKEMKGKDYSSFKGNAHKFNVELIPYKDKNKEKQKALIVEEKKKSKEEEKKKHDLMNPKKKKEEAGKGRSRSEKRKTRRETFQKDWEDLAKEARLLKKLKQGKITEEEFDEELGIKM